MIDVRCKHCNRLLGKFVICVGAIKCPRSDCGKIFEYKVYTNIHLTNTEDPTETKKLLQNVKQT